MIDSIAQHIEWLGHDGFRLVYKGFTLYIDPFRLAGSPEPADVILITHEHYDHCSPEDIEKIRKNNTVIITEPLSAKKLRGNIVTLSPGQRHEIGPFLIDAVPAYNTNKKFHPAANSWLGYIITLDDVTIYHAGDTDHIPEMINFKVDIALLPVSGTYVMTAEEAAQAALEINPRLAIPMHFDSVVGTRNDAECFAELLQGKIKVSLPRRS
jgi:L-ascorbate metabolism protein UlaG (beta-lactamase superfamily)